MSATIDDQREQLARALDPNTPAMRTKLLESIDAQIQQEGEFTALVAAFGNIDRVGDRIVAGAFEKSLQEWRASGHRIPVIWSHGHTDPHLVIGSADPAKSRETDAGLLLAGKLNVFTSAVASHVRDLLVNGDVSGWSFGFNVIKQRRAADGVNELLQLDLLEAGPTPVPANSAAHTVSVKGERVPDPEPDVPSHDELEEELIDAGIIAGHPDDDTIRKDAYEHTLRLLRDTEEHDHEHDDKADKAVSTKRKATGPVTIAEFTC